MDELDFWRIEFEMRFGRICYIAPPHPWLAEKAYDRDDDSYTETSVYSVPVGGRYDRGRPRPGGFEAPRPRAIMPQGNAVRNAFNARNARAFNLGAKAYDMGQNMFGSGDF